MKNEDNWGLVSRGTDWTTPAELEASNAIRTMGVQTLPALLKMLQSMETAWDRLRGKLNSILPQPWRTATAFARCELQRSRASRGFEALGSAALPALPQLSNWLHRPNPDVSVGWAHVPNRLTTVVVLGLNGDRAKAAVPRLLKSYAESDDPVWRSTIRSALRNIDTARVPPSDPAPPP